MNQMNFLNCCREMFVREKASKRDFGAKLELLTLKIPSSSMGGANRLRSAGKQKISKKQQRQQQRNEEYRQYLNAMTRASSHGGAPHVSAEDEGEVLRYETVDPAVVPYEEEKPTTTPLTEAEKKKKKKASRKKHKKNQRKALSMKTEQQDGGQIHPPTRQSLQKKKKTNNSNTPRKEMNRKTTDRDQGDLRRRATTT